MANYIYQQKNWPHFTWQEEQLSALLAEIQQQQRKLQSIRDISDL